MGSHTVFDPYGKRGGGRHSRMEFPKVMRRPNRAQETETGVSDQAGAHPQGIQQVVASHSLIGLAVSRAAHFRSLGNGVCKTASAIDARIDDVGLHFHIGFLFDCLHMLVSIKAEFSHGFGGF